MSNRLNQEREAKLQPERIQYAIRKLNEIGILNVQSDKTTVTFTFHGALISFYPYSGWYSGKTVKDGRGIESLLHQLKTK